MNDARLVSSSSADVETALASIAIEVLRAEGVDDATILAEHCQLVPHLDREFELTVFRESGQIVKAAAVKLAMQRMLLN